MTVDIRSAGPDDVDGIRAVASAAWHAAHTPIVGEDAVDSFLNTYYDAGSVRDRVAREDVVLDVAVDAGDAGDAVVGYVLGVPDDDAATFHLSQLYVGPDHWGEGIGRRLLDHLESVARDRGRERITLAVMVENDRAVDFYEAAGYRRTDAFHDDELDTRSYRYAKDL